MDKYENLKCNFEKLADKHQAIEMSAYMRNQFKFYGIKTPVRRGVYKELLKAERSGKRIDWVLLDKCWEDEHREFQYFVTDYLSAMQKFLVYEDIPKILKYIKEKQWWDTIDSLDTTIGNIAFTDRRVDVLMLEWSADDDFWLRRIAIDHQRSRKDKTDTQLLEKILRNNFGSDEFFINKAIGWSLREYSKTNPEWVRSFIDKNESEMSKLSIREAKKYI